MYKTFVVNWEKLYEEQTSERIIRISTNNSKEKSAHLNFK